MLEIINQYAPVKKHLATVETPFNPKELTVDTVNTLLYDVRMSDYKVIEVE